MSNIKAFPLVWVTVGKTQHPAFIMKKDESKGSYYVQWTSTKREDWVPADHVARELNPRRIKSQARTFRSKRPRNTDTDHQTELLVCDNDGTTDDTLLIDLVHATATKECGTEKSNDDVPLSELIKDDSDIKGHKTKNSRSRPRPISRSPEQLYSSNRIPAGTRLSKLPLQDMPNSLDHNAMQSENKQIPNVSAENFLGDQEDRKLEPERYKPFKRLSVASLNRSSQGQGETRSNTQRNETRITVPNSATNNQSDLLLASAYLQNLAEICFTTLHDRRWRVLEHGRLRCLFEWENGENLSAVAALSRLYVPTRTPTYVKCLCVLCRTGLKSTETSTQNDGHQEWSNSSTNEKETASKDAGEVRGMHLYCRMFYRKGPWFRIDDIYKRYYAPDKRRFNTPDECRKPSVAGHHIKQKQKLQLRETLNKHVRECIPALLNDIDSLYTCGLIRSFHDEKECGMTVGEVLLSADERRLILSKLGAGKKKTTERTSRNLHSSQKENEIWKQMSQQRPIFAQLYQLNCLPVQHHIDKLFLENLAKSIVQSCTSFDDSVSARELRSSIKEVVSEIQSLLRGRERIFGTCFRLREEPTRTLQRCVRLNLCATSGPGDMRGNGSNGWTSLAATKSNTPPLAKFIPPPGVHNYHHIQYPGLSFRFGLSSASFKYAFKPLPVECDNADETIRYTAMQQVFFSRTSFFCWELCVEIRANVDYLLEANEAIRYEERRRSNGKDPRYGADSLKGSSIDFMNLTSLNGREKLIGVMSPPSNLSQIRESIDKEIDELPPALDTSREHERVLATIGIISANILKACNVSISEIECSQIASRPWLRHLSWQGCLAYILWDIIPIFERNSMYGMAIKCLEILVFGRSTIRDSSSLMEGQDKLHETTCLAPLLLSRRARGKAVDRIVIDCGHLHRVEIAHEGNKNSKKTSKLRFQANIEAYSFHFVRKFACSGSVGFSAIRNLARRLKQPLRDSLEDIQCLESNSLGLRLCNHADAGDRKSATPKYSDWSPETDFYVANAIQNDDKGAGGRCSFVGFEETESAVGNFGSLNVEELALELYHSGRLPEQDYGERRPVRGGWIGWHDEGGHIRALFRILSAASVLGMDFGCSHDGLSDENATQLTTIHLSPYQSAPFDLHVGHEMHSSRPVQGFYHRRAARIDTFLSILSSLDGQKLCDLVYDSVSDRLKHAIQCEQKDPFIDRDLVQLRTLSAFAAGLGGKRLSSVCRTFFFDYRHYSGGLPDLSLFRALSSSESGDHILVDVGQWIGESFSPENQSTAENARAAAILFDRDDEFLGCSKVGDSGSGSSRNRRGGKNTIKTASTFSPTKKLSMELLPERLKLVHDGRSVVVESMMVEVKSLNDRLDSRQEDWLNILDHHGRVCKFESRKRGVNKT